MKIGKKKKKEWAPKNGREQGEWGKMSKEAGSIDPLTEPQEGQLCGYVVFARPHPTPPGWYNRQSFFLILQ